MKAPLFIRSLSAEEREALQAGLRSSDPFVQRRCRILLANAEGQTAARIGVALGCSTQTALNALNAFALEGLECLREKSHRPKTTRMLIERHSAEKIRLILGRSPREFGKSACRWTLAVVAQVAFEQGLSDREVSEETIRQVVKRLGMEWKRVRRGDARFELTDQCQGMAAAC